MVCPVCFNAKQLDKGNLLPNAELAGSVQLWDWIGDGATTFSLLKNPAQLPKRKRGVKHQAKSPSQPVSRSRTVLRPCCPP